MKFLAKFEGQYRYRVRVKILWFWVVQPWKTSPFTWQQIVDTPALHLAYSPVPGVPISLALDADETGAHFGIKLLGGPEIWGETIHVPTSLSQSFHFAPWKGVELVGMASCFES